MAHPILPIAYGEPWKKTQENARSIMPVNSPETHKRYVELAKRLIAEHGFDTVSFAYRPSDGSVEITRDVPVKLMTAVRELTGNELLELAHEADSAGTGITQDVLVALSFDLRTASAVGLIRGAACVALAILILQEVQGSAMANS